MDETLTHRNPARLLLHHHTATANDLNTFSIADPSLVIKTINNFLHILMCEGMLVTLIILIITGSIWHQHSPLARGKVNPVFSPCVSHVICMHLFIY